MIRRFAPGGAWPIAVLTLAATAVFWASPARGYEIQTANGSGKELHFTTMPQEFLLYEAGSLDVGDGSEFDAVRRAFKSWEDVGDSDARFSSLELTTRGLSDIYNDGGLPGRDRVNVIAWVENNWIEAPGQIAVTYTYYVDVSGKIVEDDIVMNGSDFDWTTGDAGVLTDVEAIAAHEIGHAFGLGHSQQADATMFATSALGETNKRSLSPDDQAAIRHLYPPGCCKAKKTDEGLALLGCGVSGVGAEPGASLLAAGGMLFLLIFGFSLAKRRLLAAAAVATALSAGLAGSAEASVAMEIPLETMTRDAAVVVRGTVVFSEARGSAGGSIVTVTEIEVVDVFKGDAPAVLTLIEPGGLPPGAEIGMKVSGAPEYGVGDEVLVFAESPRGAYRRHFPGAYRSFAMSQGKFDVLRADGEPARVVRDLSGTLVLAKDVNGRWEPARDDLSGMTLEDLVDRIAAELAR